MSTLVLVRHGKASAFSASDYDRLSEPGFAQARLLGRHWAQRRLSFDGVFVGPRRRHRETLECVREAYDAAGLAFPEAHLVPELDEHEGIQLLFKVMPRLAPHDPELRDIAEAMSRGEAPTPKQVLSTFKRVTRLWARGEVNHEEVESFASFRARVARGLDAMTKDSGRSKTLVAFTSAGAVAAAVATVLQLPDDEKVLDLSWSLHNASLTELAFSEGRWGMRTFNVTSHIDDPALITSV